MCKCLCEFIPRAAQGGRYLPLDLHFSETLRYSFYYLTNAYKRDSVTHIRSFKKGPLYRSSRDCAFRELSAESRNAPRRRSSYTRTPESSCIADLRARHLVCITSPLNSQCIITDFGARARVYRARCRTHTHTHTHIHVASAS